MMVITMIIITALVITEHLRKLTEEVTQMKSTEEMIIIPIVAEPTHLTMVLTDLPIGEIKTMTQTATNNKTILGEIILHQTMAEIVAVPLAEMVVLEEDLTGKTLKLL